MANGGNIIGLNFVEERFSKHNLRGKLLENGAHYVSGMCTTYTESLLPLPNDSEEKKKGM